MSHWKVYAAIEHTLQFDERGAGPILDVMQITANTHPSGAYPEQRIQVRTGNLACAGLTLEQSAQLRAILGRAERDVAAGTAGTDPPEVSETMEVNRG